MWLQLWSNLCGQKASVRQRAATEEGATESFPFVTGDGPEGDFAAPAWLDSVGTKAGWPLQGLPVHQTHAFLQSSGK